VSIVEGDGEVAALPVLLRRIGQWLSPETQFEVESPIRVKRDRFLNREGEFKRMLELAALKCGPNGWVLVLLDADDDCPVTLSRTIAARAQCIIPHCSISIVLANREYETWFIAAAASLNGYRGFSFAEQNVREPEAIRGAKEWMSARMRSGKYREVAEQPAFSARIDLRQALENSRSFRKLCDEWSKNMVRAAD
jgi:hypothetical protein